jgi:hypothetical protein
VTFAVNVAAVATPLAFVVAVVVLVVESVNTPLAPDPGAVKVTTTPLTGFEPLSTTVAARFVANAVLTVVLCGVPAVAVIVAAAPALFVRPKLAGAVAPVALAVTVYTPAVPFAVNVDDVATPLAFVVSVSVAVPPANVPLAPDPGAVNVTVTPLLGVPLVDTVATSGAANAVLTVALCPDPLVAAIVTTFVGGVEFELLHPVHKPMLRPTRASARMLP